MKYSGVVIMHGVLLKQDHGGLGVGRILSLEELRVKGRSDSKRA